MHRHSVQHVLSQNIRICVVDTATGREIRCSNLTWDNIRPVLQNVHHPASCSMRTAFKEFGAWGSPLTSIQCRGSRFGGAILLLLPIHRRGTDSGNFFLSRSQISLICILPIAWGNVMYTHTEAWSQSLLSSLLLSQYCVYGGPWGVGVNKVICDVYLRPYGAEVNERLVVEMMTWKLFLPHCKRGLAVSFYTIGYF